MVATLQEPEGECQGGQAISVDQDWPLDPDGQEIGTGGKWFTRTPVIVNGKMATLAWPSKPVATTATSSLRRSPLPRPRTAAKAEREPFSKVAGARRSLFCPC